eukprot:CAMPEP_0173179304 /NCGR_PEP_ID=MMETSP1141-20130122/6035_1 /TAXON_ID=483371 /ORGANISM="non described non described, Strain CCMP2298" /LENGTH=269 /DNA_ID=CAMNT_0014101927 /DNA_START=648 /DNA_END=1453 /DNA_ORIENTATION=+
MFSRLLLLVLSACFAVSSTGFAIPGMYGTTSRGRVQRRASLFMGRAAAVREKTKTRTDAAKAKNNNRYAKKIIMAVKAGGADLEVNRQLANVIAEAKIANVPKDIITRNIDKAKNADTADFKESLFEFYGHGGVGLLVQVLTDNPNRASAEVALVAKKNLLRSAATNSVNFKFDKKARLDVSAEIDEDMLMELCLESDVDDYELRTGATGCPLNPSEEGQSSIYVSQTDMAAVRDALVGKNFGVETKLASVPMEGFMALSDADFEANMA